LILGSVKSASRSSVNAECKSTSTPTDGGVAGAWDDGGVMIQLGSHSNDASGSGTFGDLKTEPDFGQNTQKFTFGSQAKQQGFFGSKPSTSGQIQPGFGQAPDGFNTSSAIPTPFGSQAKQQNFFGSKPSSSGKIQPGFGHAPDGFNTSSAIPTPFGSQAKQESPFGPMPFTYDHFLPGFGQAPGGFNTSSAIPTPFGSSFCAENTFMINVKKGNKKMCKSLIDNGALAYINTADKVNI
jgi:hypothetical protein